MSLEGLIIILPAFVAGLFIMMTHVPLGLEVIRRGIIFIDLAVAQIAGLGVIVASLYLHSEEYPVVQQIVAFVFAVSAAYGFQLCEKYMFELQEAVIGSAYVFASSLALLLLANHPHGTEAVENLLSGQLLWVSWSQILVMAIIYVVALVFIVNKNIMEKYFYVIFAIVITVSVQLAGVYLVFASLILPAIGGVMYARDNRIGFGYVVSILSLIVGLVGSWLMDLPTGPMLVCMLFLTLPIVLLLRVVRKR